MGMIRVSEQVQAGVYDDAYSYYQSYGNEMRFLPGVKNEGEIYYATKGKKNTSAGIRYTTIGWKVRVFNASGAVVDTVYYKLGGSHMTEIDARTINGYEYCLYRVTLANLKERLSQAGLEALKHPDCNIVFDACISVRENGELQGGMTDMGPSSGEVHTTYNGIVSAAPWSDATKESLHSYYNKTVEGLFYEVKLTQGTGIRQASGAGRYCFGTTVTVMAECEAGYHFAGWMGSKESDNQNYSFVLYGNDVSLTANARENSYRIVYDAGGGTGNIPEQKLCYNDILFLPQSGVRMEASTLSGWQLLADQALRYAVGQQVRISNLVKHLGLEKTDGAEIVIQAMWDEGPLIRTEEIYVSLEDALAGRITENWLARKAEAYDVEDGEIPYGKNEDTAFFMENYQASDFTELQEEARVSKTFLAEDSAGNITEKDILIHIIETKVYTEDEIFGRVRFISAKYFWDEHKNLICEEEGGLAEDSIWRWDAEYKALLEKLFEAKGEY